MLRVFEAFAGYGSQSIALRNLGIEHEVVAISEIDKYAIQAYEAIHGPTNNLGDICKIDPKDIPQHDLFTYSFPCQDLSVAGKQAGLGKGTRSGLLYECEKIIEHCRPKYLLLENVKNLVGKKFKPQFDEWLVYLESLGYTNYWKVLNAKDYGVPQNRERVFVVSILGEHKPYEFPNPTLLDKCIKNILENNIDEKYYINDDRVQELLSTYRSDYKTKKFDEIQQVTYPKFSQQRVYSCDGIAPTLSAGNNGGGKEPCKLLLPRIADILEDEVDEKYYLSDEIQKRFKITNQNKNIIGTTKPEFRTIGQRDLVYDKNGIMGALVATDYKQPKQIAEINSGGDKRVIEESFKIRKLTPRECFRLMGMSDDDIDKIQATGISNTQQYKMAGNSIVVNVLEAIFKNLFKGE